MGWSTAFKDQLNRPGITPRFQLDMLPNIRSLGYRAYSHQGAVKVKNFAMRGTSVIPGRWNVSFGGFIVVLQGDLRDLFQRINKGDFAAVYVTLNGVKERVAVGQLKGITRRGFAPEWTLTFVDLLQALQTSTRRNVGGQPSPSSANPPQIPLFYSAGRFSDLTANWSPGDTVLSVNQPSYFEKEATRNGVIKVSDNSGGGDFFLEYDNISGSNLRTFSGQASYPSVRAAYALTTAQNARAYHCVMLNDHPADIFGKLIQSTGTGRNGPLDTLPESSSFGGDFASDLYDISDATISKRIIRGRANVDYKWKLVFDEPPANGIRSICNLASQLGQWPIFRQGAVSWRGCFHPDNIGMSYNVTPQGAGIPIIDDNDIVEIVSHDLFAQNQTSQYTVNRLKYDNSTVPFGTGLASTTSVNVRGGFAQALPQQQEIERSSFFIYAPAASSTMLDQARGDNDRMKAFDGFTYERLTLRLKLGFAILSAGDCVAISCKYLYGLNERPAGQARMNGDSFVLKRAMVTATSFDILKQTCTIECVICSGSIDV